MIENVIFTVSIWFELNEANVLKFRTIYNNKSTPHCRSSLHLNPPPPPPRDGEEMLFYFMAHFLHILANPVVANDFIRGGLTLEGVYGSTTTPRTISFLRSMPNKGICGNFNFFLSCQRSPIFSHRCLPYAKPLNLWYICWIFMLNTPRPQITVMLAIIRLVK